MTVDERVALLKALAHPLRLRIMEALLAGERNVGEIEDAADIGQPALSQQLAVLRKAGLVRTRKSAKLVFYSIDADQVAGICAGISVLAGKASSPTPSIAPERDSQSRPNTAGVASFARLA